MTSRVVRASSSSTWRSDLKGATTGSPPDAVSRRLLVEDPAFGFLADAFDPAAARPVLARALGVRVHGVGARLLRYRAGRRLLVRFDMDTGDGPRSVLGKARAKGADGRTQRLMAALRAAGFDDHAEDGISVPAPLAVVDRWRMVLHAWVDAPTATSRLAVARGTERGRLAERMAAALAKLHASQVAVSRVHTLDDENAILRRQFAVVAEDAAHLVPRLRRVADRCGEALARLPAVAPCPSHRDFYPDQLLVADDRTYLIDLDLVALAHPALDAGNLAAHLVEHALRVEGDPSALDDLVARATAHARRATSAEAVEALTTVSLARLVAVSRRISERRATTEQLLRWVESRLDGA